MIQNEKGMWLLTENDIYISDDDMEIEESRVTAYIGTWFDVDSRLGIETEGTDDYVNIYAEYDPYTGNLKMCYFLHGADGYVSDEIPFDETVEEHAAVLSAMKKAGRLNMLENSEN